MTETETMIVAKNYGVLSCGDEVNVCYF